MEVLGAAASAIALAQLAFSLAQALNTYAGAVSDSVDDIVVIADDISDTYGHLQQLATVLEKNEKTKHLNEAAVGNAKRCVSRSQILLNKLRKLFLKSGATTEKNQVRAEQIDISKFKKALWILHKSEFELRRTELHHIKADISLIYLTYLTMASGSQGGTEKQHAIDQMKLVYAKRTVLDKDLKKARQRRNRDFRSQRTGRTSHSYRRPRETTMDPYEGSDDDEDGVGPAAIYDNMEDLYREFDGWLANKKQKEEEAAVKKKMMEERAVQEYVAKQEEASQKVQSEMQKLKVTLTQHGLPPQRIDQILKDAYPQGSTRQLNSASSSPDMQQDTTLVRPALQTSRSSTSSWRSRFLKRSDDQRVSDINNDVLGMLRDPSAPGRIAPLKALYFQRIAIAPGSNEIVHWELGLESSQLIRKLLSVTSPAQQSILTGVLQGFSGIPDDYSYHVARTLKSLHSETGLKWILLHVEIVKSKERARKFLRKREEHISGVCIVLRKVMDPGDSAQIENGPSPTDPNPVRGEASEGPAPFGVTSSSQLPTTRTHTESRFGLGNPIVGYEKEKSRANTQNFSYERKHSPSYREARYGQSLRRPRSSDNGPRIRSPRIRSRIPVLYESDRDRDSFDGPRILVNRRRDSEERRRVISRRNTYERSRTPPIRARSRSPESLSNKWKNNVTIVSGYEKETAPLRSLRHPEPKKQHNRTRRYSYDSSSSEYEMPPVRRARSRTRLVETLPTRSRARFDEPEQIIIRNNLNVPNSRPTPHYAQIPIQIGPRARSSGRYDTNPQSHYRDRNKPVLKSYRHGTVSERRRIYTLDDDSSSSASQPSMADNGDKASELEAEEILPVSLGRRTVAPEDAVQQLLNEWTTSGPAKSTHNENDDMDESAKAQTSNGNPSQSIKDAQDPAGAKAENFTKENPSAPTVESEDDVVEVIESGDETGRLSDGSSPITRGRSRSRIYEDGHVNASDDKIDELLKNGILKGGI